jgi:hypothetical protein
MALVLFFVSHPPLMLQTRAGGLFAIYLYLWDNSLQTIAREAISS